MAPNRPRDGKPGTTDQAPRWEGPEETRPRGYLPAKDDPENDPDAAGETLRNPDRRTLSDAFATRDDESGPDAGADAPAARPRPAEKPVPDRGKD